MQEEEDEKHQRFQEACYLHPSEVAERRVRLVVGMKRYFHGKRMEGLLSVKVGTSPHYNACTDVAPLALVLDSLFVLCLVIGLLPRGNML